MSYILRIDSSTMGGNSTSIKLGDEFVASFKAAHQGIEVRVRDLSAHPVPHIDGETIFADYLPEEARSATQKAKRQLRLDLIEEIANAKAVLITAPMWNWSIPSVLKAYIDHIVMVGQLDPYGNAKLKGKKVTVIVAAGGSYGAGSPHPEFDYETPYLNHIFTSLGSEDVTVVRAEFTLAGVAPGMEALVPQKEKSFEESKATLQARAAQAL